MLISDKLKIIQTALELGSFKVAAEYLKKDPSTIAKTIKDIENELGFRIFLRGRGRIELTTGGKEFYDSSLDFEHKLKHYKEKFSRKTAKNKKKGIVLKSYFGIINNLIFPYIPEFISQHKNIQLSLLGDNQGLLYGSVDEKNDPFAQCSILFKIPQRGDFIQKEIVSLKTRLYAHKSYVKQYGTPKTIADLKAQKNYLATAHNIILS